MIWLGEGNRRLYGSEKWETGLFVVGHIPNHRKMVPYTYANGYGAVCSYNNGLWFSDDWVKHANDFKR